MLILWHMVRELLSKAQIPLHWFSSKVKVKISVSRWCRSWKLRTQTMKQACYGEVSGFRTISTCWYGC